MLKKYGFIRVGAYSCDVKVGDIDFNSDNIILCINEAYKKGIEIVCFPQLSITSYTLGDLFLQDTIISKSKEAIVRITRATKELDIISIVGLPIYLDNQLFNCACVIEKGKILGIVPKSYIPNYGEFYEKRWFSSGNNALSKYININGNEIPFGNDLIFKCSNYDFSFGIEICEDLWSLFPPSSVLAYKGASIIFNLSSSNEIVGKCNYLKNLVKSQSSKTISGYVYASSSAGESTTDLVFSGHSMICENGKILKESERLSFDNQLIYDDIDILKLKALRYKEKSYMDYSINNNYREVPFELFNKENNLLRAYNKYPFIPNDIEVCKEIMEIQATGLAKRLKYINCNKVTIGVSGGLDSTLAFLVCVKAFKKLEYDLKGIIGITMPGFGTSSRTLNNSLRLMKYYGVTIKNIDIKEACKLHLKDIEHDETFQDITYENVQARERTQILMDVANKENAIVVGTGDLSETALGWCTYNGDQMSMYNVNSSIPKTLVKYLVNSYALCENKEVQEILSSIIDTPVSPELLPTNDDKIVQLSENKIGPYALHDFFIYHFLRYGAKFSKIYYLAINTFDEYEKEEILKWLKLFIKRFFNQQFKRSAMPDGVKVGTISLSPRGDLRMASDTSYISFIKELEEEIDEK